MRINIRSAIRLRANAEADGARTVVSVRDPVAIDKSEEARDWLTTEQGSLLQRYEFINALAQAPAKVGAQREAGYQNAN